MDYITNERQIAFGYNLREIIKGKLHAVFEPEAWATRQKDGTIRVELPYLGMCYSLKMAEAGMLADAMIGAV